MAGLVGTSPRPTIYDYISHIERAGMREIQLKDAKATLSALVDHALRGEQFVIPRHGKKQAVVISWAAWERLSKIPSFGRLLASSPLEEDDLPDRDPSPGRDADV